MTAALEQELKESKTSLQMTTDEKLNLEAKLTAASIEQEKLLEALSNSQQVVLKISNDFSELNKKVISWCVNTFYSFNFIISNKLCVSNKRMLRKWRF